VKKRLAIHQQLEKDNFMLSILPNCFAQGIGATAYDLLPRKTDKHQRFGL